jgi:hypothetical protein
MRKVSGVIRQQVGADGRSGPVRQASATAAFIGEPNIGRSAALKAAIYRMVTAGRPGGRDGMEATGLPPQGISRRWSR